MNPRLKILLDMARSLGRRRRGRPRRRQANWARNAERDMLRSIIAYLDQLDAIVTRRVQNVLPSLISTAPKNPSARQDGFVEIAVQLFEGIVKEVDAIDINNLFRAVLNDVAQQTDAFSRREFTESARRQIGLDINIAVDDFSDLASLFVHNNTQLIKSIKSQYLEQVEGIVTRGVSDGLRAEAISEQLQERLGVAKSRAALIARDQVGKLTGQLDRARMSQTGITQYTWVTVGDERVRSRHRELNGRVFDLVGPGAPGEGHPGDPIRCRCVAEPKFPKL